MDLAGAGVANHADDLAAGRAADDGVINQDDALAVEYAAHRVELELDAEVAHPLLRLDEGAADVVTADQPDAERQPAFAGVADGGGHTGVGHGHDDVGVHRRLARQLAAEGFAAVVG